MILYFNTKSIYKEPKILLYSRKIIEISYSFELDHTRDNDSIKGAFSFNDNNYSISNISYFNI